MKLAFHTIIILHLCLTSALVTVASDKECICLRWTDWISLGKANDLTDMPQTYDNLVNLGKTAADFQNIDICTVHVSSDCRILVKRNKINYADDKYTACPYQEDSVYGTNDGLVQMRFLCWDYTCSCLEWSKWYNHDRPHDIGDVEILGETIMRDQWPCPDGSSALDVECRAADGRRITETTNRMLYCGLSGFRCLHDLQAVNNMCEDFIVRFLCLQSTIEPHVYLQGFPENNHWDLDSLNSTGIKRAKEKIPEMKLDHVDKKYKDKLLLDVGSPLLLLEVKQKPISSSTMMSPRDNLEKSATKATSTALYSLETKPINEELKLQFRKQLLDFAAGQPSDVGEKLRHIGTHFPWLLPEILEDVWKRASKPTRTTNVTNEIALHALNERKMHFDKQLRDFLIDGTPSDVQHKLNYVANNLPWLLAFAFKDIEMKINDASVTQSTSSLTAVASDGDNLAIECSNPETTCTKKSKLNRAITRRYRTAKKATTHSPPPPPTDLLETKAKMTSNQELALRIANEELKIANSTPVSVNEKFEMNVLEKSHFGGTRSEDQSPILVEIQDEIERIKSTITELPNFKPESDSYLLQSQKQRSQPAQHTNPHYGSRHYKLHPHNRQAESYHPYTDRKWHKQSQTRKNSNVAPVQLDENLKSTQVYNRKISDILKSNMVISRLAQLQTQCQRSPLIKDSSLCKLLINTS